MASHSSSSPNLYRLGSLRPSNYSPTPSSSSSSSTRYHFSSHITSNFGLKAVRRSNIRVNAYFPRHRLVKIAAMDEVKHGVEVEEIVNHILQAWESATGKKRH